MRKMLKNINWALFALVILFSLGACNRAAESITEAGSLFPTPPNEPKVEFAKWHRVEFRFTEGHSHGYFHGKAEFPVKYLKSVQKLFFTNQNGTLVPDPENQPIRWQASRDKGMSLYALEIIYYDKEGKRINSSFTSTTPGEQYQHFFLPENITPRPGNTSVVSPENIFKYTYSDTDPEDKYFRNSLDGEDPSVKKLLNDYRGLKGVFEVNNPYQNFDLKVVLGKFGKEKTKFAHNALPTSNFYKAYEVKLPIHIYTSRNANEDIQRKDAAKEYGVTEEQIEEDEDIILDSPIDPESSNVFLHLK